MPTMFEGLGVEALVDETLFILRDKLDNAMTVVNEGYAEQDQRRALIMGVPYVPVVMEPIPSTNFHSGSIPSFVASEDRAGEYPMCVVVPGRTVPDGENQSADQYDVLNNAITIHVFSRAKMTDAEGFDLSYRRAERMTEAVYRLIRTDRDLRKLFAGLSGPVVVERSEPWVFPHEDGHGDDWVWNAVMQQYQIKNYSHTPTEV